MVLLYTPIPILQIALISEEVSQTFLSTALNISLIKRACNGFRHAWTTVQCIISFGGFRDNSSVFFLGLIKFKFNSITTRPKKKKRRKYSSVLN